MSSTEAQGAQASAAERAQFSIERLLSRHGLIAGAALAAAVVLAWWWLAKSGMSALPMNGHGMGAMTVDPWSPGYLLPAFVMWSNMMVAMMLPSAAPMILLHARIDRAPDAGRRLLHTAIFSLSYLLVWTLFSAAAAFAQALLVELGLLSGARLVLGDRVVAAALLVGAALYQLSPVKAACLDQCRSPIHFIMRSWSPGVLGAVRLGLAHGSYCLGCCWGLMLLLFVAGVMNLGWVALLAAVVFVEKLAPPAWHANRLIALGLVAGAVALLLSG